MIAIQRGPEPAGWSRRREQEVSRVSELRAQGALTRADIGGVYTELKRPLWEAQRCKCCYCEQMKPDRGNTSEPRRGNTVEHFRPVILAVRTPGSAETEGYWWLAWSWENLLFACRECNEAKGSQFPLAPGSIVLRPGEHPPGKERALLLDPCRPEDAPEAHLTFAEVEGQWGPIERPGSERGRSTIATLRLHTRQALRDAYNRHVRTIVKEEVDKVRAAMASGEARAVAEAWNQSLKRLLAPTQQFTALSRAALAHFIDAPTRERWGLGGP